MLSSARMKLIAELTEHFKDVVFVNETYYMFIEEGFKRYRFPEWTTILQISSDEMIQARAFLDNHSEIDIENLDPDDIPEEIEDYCEETGIDSESFIEFLILIGNGCVADEKWIKDEEGEYSCLADNIEDFVDMESWASLNDDELQDIASKLGIC